MSKKNITQTESIFNRWNKAWDDFKGWREQVQELAVDTVLHVYQYRNATVILHALEGMEKAGKGADKKALVEWFQHHSPCLIEWNSKTKSFEATMLNKDKKDVVKALTDGKVKKWWQYAKPVDWKGFDINAAIQNVISQSQSALKRATKLNEAGKPVPTVRYSIEKIQALQAALAMPDEVWHPSDAANSEPAAEQSDDQEESEAA